MIEVYIKYIHKITTSTRDDYYIFPSFIVKGHANNGTSSVECMKVCASITACCAGVRCLLNDSQYSVKLQRGLFEIKNKFTLKDKDTYCDLDTCYALNTLWCQLYHIYALYPSQFKCFVVEELKENEVFYETNNPKPFRELMDIPSRKKRLYRKERRKLFID